MKSFKGLLSVLVFILLVPTHPVFGADNQGEQEFGLSEPSNLVQQFFRPDSLLGGVYEYCRMLPRRPVKERWRVFSGICASVAAFPVLRESWQLRHRDKGSVCLGVAFFAVSGALLADSLYFSYKNIDLLRNIQRALCMQHVEDQAVKTYIATLAGIGYRYDSQLATDFIRDFFEWYRQVNLHQLQACAEQLLIEENICAKKDDGSGVEFSGDPLNDLGPELVGEIPYKLLLLHTILYDQGNEGANGELNLAGQQDWEDHLNHLLGFPTAAAQNKKGACREVSKKEQKEEEE